jgi:hypothetical protein
MEKQKLKKSKTLSINIHDIESKAFTIYMRRRIPGMTSPWNEAHLVITDKDW